MAILQGMGVNDRARLSTPGPVDVPRWEDDTKSFTNMGGGYDTPDFSQLFQTPQKQQMPLVGLSLPKLGLPSLSDWVTNASQTPEPEPPGMSVEQMLATASGGGGGGSGGGMGMSAYGYSGRTGLPNLKGSSPYGFQTQMWSALSAANAAMQKAGLGQFGITDGFRSYAAQVDVKKRKGNLAATPGRSIHGLGLAADLDLSKAQVNWLKQNGAKFGLVNLPSESWHWQLSPSLWKGFG